MVPIIIGRSELTDEQERKSKVEKKMEERVKRMRNLSHTVQHISSGSTFFFTVPIIFTQHDLALIRLPHEDLLVSKLQIDNCLIS